MVQNKAIIFKAIPDEFPVAGQHLAVETRDFDIDQEPPNGGVTLQNHYASLDPYQRARLRSSAVKSYVPAYERGKPIANYCISKVLKSNTDQFHAGDVVYGVVPIEEYSVLGPQMLRAIRRVDNPHSLDIKLFLGPLGMPGITAYSSLYEIGKPKRGETIFISAASGAVGQVVGQLAKHEGLRVIGSVGDDDKLAFIKDELAFDEGFNYKKEKPLAALRRLAPEGIDIYYENVGGEHLDAALVCMKNFGRIVASGMISVYNKKPEDQYGVKNLAQVVSRRLLIQGFIQGDPNMGPKWSEEHQKNVQQWLRDGSFKAKLSVTDGIENVIHGLIDLFHGRNFGKAIVKIADLEQ